MALPPQSSCLRPGTIYSSVVLPSELPREMFGVLRRVDGAREGLVLISERARHSAKLDSTRNVVV